MLRPIQSKISTVSAQNPLAELEGNTNISATTNVENKSAGIETNSSSAAQNSLTQSTLPKAQQSILNAHSTRRQQSEWDEPAYRSGERVEHHFSVTKLPHQNQIKNTAIGKTSIDRTNTIPKNIRNNTGIVLAHLQPLQQLAEQENCVLAIRHVDRLSTQLIEAGHPTKNFHIKGKSASWGPQAGMICVDQRFSKMAGQDEQKIRKYTQQVSECISNGHAVAVDLKLSKDRLNTLLEKNVITLHEEKDGIITLLANNPVGNCEKFFAQKQEDGHYLIHHENQPLTVLADKMHSLPLTADYDLLLVAPSLKDFGNHDNLPVSDISHQTFLSRMGKYKSVPTQLQSYLKPDFFYQKEDPNLGNASERIRHMIPKINHTLKCGPGKEVVHHNVDSSSPAADPAANYPATFFTPFAIDGKKIHIVMNTDEMRKMIQEIKQAGYHTRLNPLWEKEVAQIKRPSFSQATEILRNSKQSEVPH